MAQLYSRANIITCLEMELWFFQIMNPTQLWTILPEKQLIQALPENYILLPAEHPLTALLRMWLVDQTLADPVEYVPFEVEGEDYTQIPEGYTKYQNYKATVVGSAVDVLCCNGTMTRQSFTCTSLHLMMTRY